jgi:hypothetical protein
MEKKSGMDNIVNVEDNFLTEEEHVSVLYYCMNSKYGYGEVDRPELAPTGMVADIEEHEDIYKFFKEKTEPFAKGLVIDRMYINSFAPSENPYFHTDSGVHTDITCLYYANDTWKVDDGGATEFWIDGNFVGVAPMPNRLLYFSADIPHRATSFRNRYRFTLAIKYTDPNGIINPTDC